jgi:hypothetical protein
MHGPGNEKALDGDKTSVNPPINRYELRIYSLNDTERYSLSMGTLFRFTTHDLPFDFGSLGFGDFREDVGCSSRYYAGMGLLASAGGRNATLTLWEPNGHLIQEIAYHGQSLIAVGGWESISMDNDGAVMDHSWGSMAIAAHDWKDGNWNPESGILVEHSTNVTITKATIDLMVFEPTGTTDIPEFAPVPAGLMAAVLIFLIRRRMTRRIDADVD